jgi:hypothetical protein
MPGLVNRLVRVRTPRPGLHVYYRCSLFDSSQKLAHRIAKDDFGHAALDLHGNAIRMATIETRGEGGYAIIPPSPSRVHPTGRLYQYADGSADLTAIPVITPEERSVLLNAASSLSECAEVKSEKRPAKRTNPSKASSLPGDDFNARATWADVLTPHGWSVECQYGEETRWCRPGKSGGISASTNHNGSDFLHVFTTNGGLLETDKSYSKFAAYAALNHDGDFKEAARDLREQGYGKNGKKPLKAGKR